MYESMGEKGENTVYFVPLDTSGIEPDTSRMLSGRDKPTTPCALAKMWSELILAECFLSCASWSPRTSSLASHDHNTHMPGEHVTARLGTMKAVNTHSTAFWPVHSCPRLRGVANINLLHDIRVVLHYGRIWRWWFVTLSPPTRGWLGSHEAGPEDRTRCVGYVLTFEGRTGGRCRGHGDRRCTFRDLDYRVRLPSHMHSVQRVDEADEELIILSQRVEYLLYLLDRFDSGSYDGAVPAFVEGRLRGIAAY